jgi:Zn finger protein HypA/HybF involved in hydrogenase expression
MHEVAAIQGVVNHALASMREAGASRVTNVEMSIGVSGHFTEDVVRQYFTLFTATTPAEGATLTIVWLPATYQCLSCLNTFQSLQPAVEALCPDCGDMALEIGHQDICVMNSIDVSYEEDAPLGKEQQASEAVSKDEAATWQA